MGHDLSELKSRIVTSGLVDAQTLDVIAAQEPAVADGAALLDRLKAKERLTEFEAEALAAGLTGPFRIGPYTVHERVAVGRLGDVFRAVHEEFSQPISLKLFSAELANDPDKLARAQRELRVSVQVDHPHLLRSFHLGRLGDRMYLAFEDLDGESLEQRLARVGKLPYAEACRLLHQAALGLESLHGAEIVHRDLRPGAMWVKQSEQLKLMEFGAARDALAFLDTTEGGQELTLHDSMLGDGLYRAPEAIVNAHAANEASDVYSLGCVLYHALAGAPPFNERNPLRLADAHANQAPTAIAVYCPDAPSELCDLVARSLAKDPADRPTTADLDWGLSRWAADSSLSGAPEETWNPEYLSWLKEQGAYEAPAAEQPPVSGDVAEFLDWLSAR